MDISEAEKANDFIKKNGPEYARFVAHREDLDEGLKVTEARLMNSHEGPEHVKKAYARSHEDYQVIREGRKVAREEELKLKILIQAAQNQFEMWRSWNSANKKGA
jgi:hypothetical protein